MASRICGLKALFGALVVVVGLVTAGCSNPNLEAIASIGDDSGDSGPSTSDADASTGDAETDSGVAATDETGTGTSGDSSTTSDVSPLGVETSAEDAVQPAPTAVFSAEDDSAVAPPVTGAYLVARTGAGRQVPGSGAPVFILPVYDEPDGTARSLVYTRPNDSTLRYPLTNPSFFGNPLVLRVVSGMEGDEWIQVQAPIRPARRWVWVRGTDFTWVDGDERLELDMSDSTLRAYRGDERLLSTRVATGAVDTPTPLGLSYVSEVIGSGSPIFNLALFANTNSAAGQPLPAITLVGTSDRSELGDRITRGTVRAPNDVLTTLADEISPGALVLIFDSSEESTNRDAIASRPLEPAETIAP